MYSEISYKLAENAKLNPETLVSSIKSQTNATQVSAHIEPEESNLDSIFNYITQSVFSYVIQVIQYLIIFPLPQVVCNLLGLTFLNAFPGEVKQTVGKVKESNGGGNSLAAVDPSRACNGVAARDCIESVVPHICFRVVTRGNYPELVQSNVHRNFLTCLEAGLMDFSFEVATDKDINLTDAPAYNRIRQLIVPKDYRTPTGALFKARALQYALEPGVSPLKAGDYIVHLDEETIISNNVVRGIANFASKGAYSFGQGLITYANLDVVNILTTMADSYRVADDMGKVQFQLAVLHKPIFGWKGSFVVSKYEAELDVSYDHGPDGSIAEDCYFSMVAMEKGYKFDFVQGEMYEKSPFTLMDFIRQRRRWVQGIWLVVHNFKIPIRTKFFLILSHYAALTLPLVTLNVFLNLAIKIPAPIHILVMEKFCAAITIYMYMFGLLKTLDLKPRSIPIIILYIMIQMVTLTLNAIFENIAVIWGAFSSKHNFYVVKKDLDGKVILDS